MNLKKAQKHPKQQEIFDLSIKARPQVSELVNDGSNNLNQETLPSKTPFNQEDQVLSPLKVLKAVVEENPKQTARELAKRFSTCHRPIITQLNKLGKVSKKALRSFQAFKTLLKH